MLKLFYAYSYVLESYLSQHILEIKVQIEKKDSLIHHLYAYSHALVLHLSFKVQRSQPKFFFSCMLLIYIVHRRPS